MKIIEARFAETVKIGANQEEQFINTNIQKHYHYEMFLSEIGMLWIHDKNKDVWVGTSASNLRYIMLDKSPFEGLKDEVGSGASIQRAGKKGEIRTTKS